MLRALTIASAECAQKACLCYAHETKFMSSECKTTSTKRSIELQILKVAIASAPQTLKSYGKKRLQPVHQNILSMYKERKMLLCRATFPFLQDLARLSSSTGPKTGPWFRYLKTHGSKKRMKTVTRQKTYENNESYEN